MLELPSGTLWSTVFEHPFIIHVRHAPTHTPESRTRRIVIARTKYVKHNHWSSHDTLFRNEVPLTRLSTWSSELVGKEAMDTRTMVHAATRSVATFPEGVYELVEMEEISEESNNKPRWLFGFEEAEGRKQRMVRPVGR